MIWQALSEAAERNELLLVAGGMCRFHLRRDGVVVIREILVLPGSQRQGIGRQMVETVGALHPASPILARCPATYPSNGFWERLGFTLQPPAKEGLNEWLLSPG